MSAGVDSVQTTLGLTGLVVNLDNGHNGWCVEIAPGAAYCGETFDRAEERVGIFAVERPPDHPHCTFCFECGKVDTRQLRKAARNRMEGSA